MSWTLVTSMSAHLGASGGTTPGIDTTGANLLVIFADCYNSTPTLTDSKGNTWTALTEFGGNAGLAAWYCAAPTVGAGHTFTVDTTLFTSVHVLAYSGAAAVPYDGSVMTATGSGTSLATGSYTPTTSGCLLIAAVSLNAGVDAFSELAIDSGFTIRTQQSYVNGTDVGGGTADFVQTSAAAADPTWSWVTSSTASAGIIAFKPAAGGTTYSDSVTEAATASDTVTDTASMVASNAEAAAGADSVTNTATLTASLSEAAVGSETITDTAALGASITETCAAADTITNGNVFSSSCTDAANATDSVSATAAMAGSLSESLTAADASSTLAVLGEVLLEVALASDAPSGALVAGATITDAATAGDTFTATSGTVTGRKIGVNGYDTTKKSLKGYDTTEKLVTGIA